MNTKHDYEYIRATAASGWRDAWRHLLEGRFCTCGDELLEDPNAPIHRLGFTVAEVEAAIGFAGLTDREVEWRRSQPDRYRLEGEEWVEVEGWRQARDRAALAEAVAAKVVEIEAVSAQLQQDVIEFGNHHYYADTWSTRAVESCCAAAANLGLDDSAPVRVPPPLQPGWWLTADTDESGDRVAVQMTVGEMRQLSAALYDRNGAVWGKAMIHKAMVEAMAAEGATVEDIAAYDHLEGWI